METLKVTLKKSHFGRKKGHQATVFALGLKKINSCRVLEDTPAIRGMIEKVKYLVEVVENSDD